MITQQQPYGHYQPSRVVLQPYTITQTPRWGENYIATAVDLRKL